MEIRYLIDRTINQIALPDSDYSPESVEIDPEVKQRSDQSEDRDQIVFEPVNTDPYDLSYTCLLIPRFASHYLLGDISHDLREWMMQICISFGWRLEFLKINSEYLEWAIRVSPSTSTAYFMQIIRQQTSVYIFENFPRIRRENISKEFWAPDYIINMGSHPHPLAVIREFIQKTRQNQGVYPSD